MSTNDESKEIHINMERIFTPDGVFFSEQKISSIIGLKRYILSIEESFFLFSLYDSLFCSKATLSLVPKTYV